MRGPLGVVRGSVAAEKDVVGCSCQPLPEDPLAALDVLCRDVLVLLVGEHRVTGAEVHRRDPEPGELGDVGPAELRGRLAAHRLDERLGRRAVEPGHRTGGHVGDGDVVAVEEVAHEGLGVGLAPVGGEAEVDLDDALVGDHVACDAAPDAGRVEALVEGQAVDLRLPGDVVVEAVEHGAGEVDGVDAPPAARAVGALARRAHVHAHRALAARLDGGVARLHEDREVGLQEGGVALGQLAQAVVDRVDLLGLVEDEGEVAVGRGDVGGELEHHRVAALHVAAAEPVQDAVLQARGQVVVERHGVEVPRDHHPLAQPELGARHGGVPTPGHGEVGQGAQGRLDRIGDLLLLMTDGGDVDELLGQADDVGGQVEVGHAPIQPARRPAAARSLRQARATCTSASAASAYDTEVASVSSAIRASWVRAAARVPAGPAIVRLMRSLTCRPASLRACWTARTRSRAVTSASSSGVTAVSRATKPPRGSMPIEVSSSDEPATVSRAYSPSTSASPPAVTVPSSATDQSPDFDPLIASWTSLPRRGPAARALTVSRCETPYDAASGASTASTRTSLRFSSSATSCSKPARSASVTTVRPASGRRLRRLAALRSAEPAEQTSRTVSIDATSDASAGRSSADGQSVRWTERSPVRPRQTSSVVSGISGAVARQTTSSTVWRVSNASASSSQNRSRERRMYQLVSTSRKLRVESHAAATS